MCRPCVCPDATRVWAFLLTWPLALLRMGMLVAPPICILLTLNTNSLAAFTLLRIWAPHMAKALTHTYEPTISVSPDMILLLMSGIKTMRVLLTYSPSSFLDLYWLVPIQLTSMYITLQHLTLDVAPQLGPPRIGYNPAWLVCMIGTILASTGALLFFNHSIANISFMLIECGLGLSLVGHVWNYHSTREQEAWVGGSYILLTFMYIESSTLVLDGLYEDIIRSSTIFIIGVLSILAVADTKPYTTTSSCATFSHIMHKALNIGIGTIQCIFYLTSSIIPYQIAVLSSATIIAHSATSVWFTSKMKFPPNMEKDCGFALDVIDKYIRLFYQFTSDPDFQATLEVAIPQVATMRGGMYRLLNHAYSPLNECTNGKNESIQPSSSNVLLITIGFLCITALGLLSQVFPHSSFVAFSPSFWAISSLGGLICIVACHILSDASSVFWFSIFKDATYTREYTQTGTIALYAQLAFIVSCIALFVCLSLPQKKSLATGQSFHMQTVRPLPSNRIQQSTTRYTRTPPVVHNKKGVSSFESVYTKGKKDKHHLHVSSDVRSNEYTFKHANGIGTQASLEMQPLIPHQTLSLHEKHLPFSFSPRIYDSTYDIHSESIQTTKSTFCQTIGLRMRMALYDVYDFLTKPSLILAAVCMFGLVCVILSVGSPIQSISIEKNTTRTPDWVTLTKVDRFLAATTSLQAMILDDASRPILMAVMMIEYAIRKFGCLACFCVPDIFPVVDKASTFFGLSSGDAINILNFITKGDIGDIPELPSTGPLSDIIKTLKDAANRPPDVNQTSILPSCVTPTCDAGLTQICIVNILEHIGLSLVGFVISGIELASTFVVDELVSLIPMADIITTAISEISKIAHLIEFELLALPGFDIHLGFDTSIFSLELGILPAFNHPMITQVSTKTYIIGSFVAFGILVFLIASGLGSIALHSVFMSAQILTMSSIVIGIGSIIILEFELKLLLQREGYNLVIVYAKTLYLYGIVLAGFIYCAFLRLSGS